MIFTWHNLRVLSAHFLADLSRKSQEVPKWRSVNTVLKLNGIQSLTLNVRFLQLSADGLLMNKIILLQTYPLFYSAFAGLADYLWVKCWKLIMNIILVIDWQVEGTLVKKPKQGKIIESSKGNVYIYSELKSTTIKLIFVTLVHTKVRNLRHSSEATKARENHRIKYVYSELKNITHFC